MELLTRYYDEKIILKRAVDIACPAKVLKHTAIFYVHGGGWNAGNRDGYHRHLQHFSENGYLCASAGYRLVPEAVLEEQMGDIAKGYDVFISFIKEKGINIKNIIVIGSSAGAHLSSLLALTEPTHFNPEISLTNEWIRPVACISVNGPATLEKLPDLNPIIKKSTEALLRVSYEEYEKNKEVFLNASPIYHVNDSSPDFLFLLAGKEEYFPHEFIYNMKDKLEGHGKKVQVVLFPEAEHGFFYSLSSEIQKEALAVMESFVANY